MPGDLGLGAALEGDEGPRAGEDRDGDARARGDGRGQDEGQAAADRRAQEQEGPDEVRRPQEIGELERFERQQLLVDLVDDLLEQVELGGVALGLRGGEQLGAVGGRALGGGGGVTVVVGSTANPGPASRAVRASATSAASRRCSRSAREAARASSWDFRRFTVLSRAASYIASDCQRDSSLAFLALDRSDLNWASSFCLTWAYSASVVWVSAWALRTMAARTLSYSAWRAAASALNLAEASWTA
ncbi:hypothetical protein VT85_12475 [Planctomyces sp. SH-PL62]|nr:hypothetical protein VT85_12475 [Planctomyces sp. SH-PL62]